MVLLTDRRSADRGLAEVVAAAVAGGVRWVVLREKDLARPERAALAAELRAILADADGTLVVAGPDPLGGDAVHLPAAGPYPTPRLGLVGRSCHDRAELDRLTTEDYVTVSPVHPTRTKPGYGPPLHPEGLADLVRVSPVPVLALGGIETPDQVRSCVAAGAVGVAGGGGPPGAPAPPPGPSPPSGPPTPPPRGPRGARRAGGGGGGAPPPGAPPPRPRPQPR
ncbi:thiamine phosphate synthase [Micromonospora echinospora]|uniref:thiamine phosphate synthase n=1 Tax=Micromonospora echinospora TaxID=1877 RepID=UPI00367216B2